jgi:4-hydroxy-2-oxoheptanedioate aldolase
MTLAEHLHRPGPLYSALMMIPDPAVASVLGSCGLDFVSVDGEHGEYTPDAMRACVDTLKAVPTPVVVRPATNGDADLRQVLDLGVDGVLVPHVETVEHAAAIVGAASAAGAATLVILESRLGIENAEAIAAVPGLDGIMVGPSDLSADLGVAGQLDHPSVRDRIERVFAIGLETGLKVSPWREARTDAERDGMLVYLFADVTTLAEAAKAAVDAVRR